jgi:hypothetical protein
MKLEIHPSAENNFNERAARILGKVRELPQERPQDSAFPSERHVSMSVRQEDMIGEPELVQRNSFGAVVGRYFLLSNKAYGLVGDDYVDLVDFAERVQKVREIQPRLSAEYIETNAFSWIRECYCEHDHQMSFMAYLKAAASQSVKSFRSWVPIANLEVEVGFRLGDAFVQPLSQSFIDDWQRLFAQTANADNTDKSVEGLSKIFEHVRREFQGLACVTTLVEAEPLRARQIAYEQAEQATMILAIFSKAILTPDLKSVARVKGSENLCHATCLQFDGYEQFLFSSEVLDRPVDIQWRLGREDIARFQGTALDSLNELLIAEEQTDFQKSILTAVLLYAKAAFVAEPIEKVVYALSALESILLRDEAETIQQNLAERLAFLISKERDERKDIIRNVKKVYGFRSRYLHHGQSSAELQTISDFLMHAWVSIVQLLANRRQFQNKLDFLNALDDLKFS